MKILVFGAGVLGSMYAVRLKQAGNDVTILARGKRFEEIQKNGIILESMNRKTFTTTFVPVVDKLTPDDAYDLILVIVRKNQVETVLPMLAANKYSPNILFLGNNVRGIPHIVAALGKERVLMGFGAFGGLREGGVVRYLETGKGRNIGYTLAGELDGKDSPRLHEIAEAFKKTGLPVRIEENVDAWLKTHFALVGPVAGALYMAGGDNYRLARTRDALILLIRGVKEGFKVLKVLGIPVIPDRLGRLGKVPEPFLVVMLKRMMKMPYAEVSMAGHANAARDEMSALAQEFKELIHQSGLPTPSLDRLFSYYDPATPVVTAGSEELRMDWKPVWVGMAAVLGFISLVLMILWRLVGGKVAKKK